tara:strand:+ start:709 stop:918 length:210 start_codon:yes stop_codon:yes gene_type:complete
VKVGDLVTIKPHVQPPHIYGVGLVIEIQTTDIETWGKEVKKVKVMWSKLPNKTPMYFNADNAELVNESR